MLKKKCRRIGQNVVITQRNISKIRINQSAQRENI
jgi:hypothetical protein